MAVRPEGARLQPPDAEDPRVPCDSKVLVEVVEKRLRNAPGVTSIESRC